MPPLDLNTKEYRLKEKYGNAAAINKRDVLSAAMYPKVRTEGVDGECGRRVYQSALSAAMYPKVWTKGTRVLRTEETRALWMKGTRALWTKGTRALWTEETRALWTKGTRALWDVVRAIHPSRVY